MVVRVVAEVRTRSIRASAKTSEIESVRGSLISYKIQLWLSVRPSRVVLPEFTSYAVDIALTVAPIAVPSRILKTLGEAASEVISE